MKSRSLLPKIVATLNRGSGEIIYEDDGRVIVETSLSFFEGGDTYPPFEELYFDHISDLELEEISSLSNYQYSLLGAIQTLHMASNGSYGGISAETVKAIYNLLKKRLDGWRMNSNSYDECVKKMLEITLEEYRNSFWRK